MQALYMYSYIDPLDNPLTTRQFLMGRKIPIELYSNSQFESIKDADYQIWHRFRSDPDPDLKSHSRTVADTHIVHIGYDTS